MNHNKAVWIPFWILVLFAIIGTVLINSAKADNDCLDYAIASGEPVVLIGYHPFFYGGYQQNHFVNYELAGYDTFLLIDHKTNHSYMMKIDDIDEMEIRNNVYHDGFGVYYKFYQPGELLVRHQRRRV